MKKQSLGSNTECFTYTLLILAFSLPLPMVHKMPLYAQCLINLSQFFFFFFGNTEISGFIRHPDPEAGVGLQRRPSLSLTLSVHDTAIKLKQKEDTHVLINLSSKCNLIHLRRQRVVTWLFLVELCYPSPKNIDMNVFDKIVKLTTH